MKPPFIAFPSRFLAISLFIFFLLVTTTSGAQDVTNQAAPIPHPPLNDLEKEVFEQLKQGKNELEKKLSNPELDPVNRALAYGKLGHLYHTYEFFEAAQACYYNAATINPSVYRWNYCMGFILQEKGEYENALEYYKRARAIQVTAELIYLVNIRIGECYQALNQLDNAGYSYELAQYIFPDGANILARLGELSLARKQYEKAITYLTQALEKVPDANKLHYPLAMAYRRAGNTDLAKKHLAMRGKVGLHPPDPLMDKLKSLKRGFRVHILDGKMAFSAKRYKEAALAFEKAVKSKPEDPGARVNLGTAYIYLKDYPKGQESLEKAIELDPENMTAHYNLGEISVYSGDFKKAIDHLTRFITAHPEDAMAHQYLATALRNDNRPQKALIHYKRAIELDKTLAASWLDLSTLLFAGDYYHHAIQILEEAHTTLPHNIEIAHQLARYLAMTPDIKLRSGARALELAERSFNENPHFKSAKTVAIAFAELDQCDKAAEWIKKSIKLAKESSQTGTTLQSLNRNLEYLNSNRPCRIPYLAKETTDPSTDALPDMIFVQIPVNKGPSPNQGSHRSGIHEQKNRYIDGCRIVRLSPASDTPQVVSLTPDFVSAVDPSISFDGKTILFSAKKKAGDFWQIYRMNIDGSSITQLTHEQYDHVSPLHVGTLFYLNDSHPTGQIIYGQRRPVPESPYAIVASNLDGTNPRRVSFNLFSDVDPEVLPNGRLVFSSVYRKESLPSTLASRLLAMNIDGTDLMPFTGDQVFSTHQRLPRSGFDKRLYYLESDSSDYLRGGMIASVSQLRSLHSRKMVTQSADRVYHSPCPLPDGSLLASYMKKDGQGLYAIGKVDTHSGHLIQTLYTSSTYHCVDTHLIQARPQARGRSSVVGFKYKDSGAIFCMDVYNSDREEITARVKPDTVKEVLITQAILHVNPTTTNHQQYPSAPFSVFHRVIGKSPVEKDGSFHVRVPSELPLTYHLLDANGMNVGRQESFTWVMHGENRGCIGCHEDRELSPPNRFIDAVKRAEDKLAIDPAKPGTIDFVSHAFPILGKRCTTCHVTGKIEPFFDIPEKAYRGLIGGEKPAVIPFEPTRSPLFNTLFNLNKKDVHKLTNCTVPLTDSEKKVLIDWVNLGAAYEVPETLLDSTYQQ